MTDNMTERDHVMTERAAAHSVPAHLLRKAQQPPFGITDLMMARVMLAIERGDEIHKVGKDRWVAAKGTRLGLDPSPTVAEMLRTGLLRCLRQRRLGAYEDIVLPAPVHLKDLDEPFSMCRFVGEDLGPMRARLVTDMRLVDCLDCEYVVAHGRHPRGVEL